MSMDVEAINRDVSGNIEVKIVLNKKEIQNSFEKAFSLISRRVKHSGFRPGKIPKSIVQKHYADVVKREAFNILLRYGVGKAIRQHALDVLSETDFLNLDIAYEQFSCDNESFEFTVRLCERPKVVSGQYQGLKVQAVQYVYNDDVIQEFLDGKRIQNIAIIRKDNGVVADNDEVQVQYAFYLMDPEGSSSHLTRVRINVEHPWFKDVQKQWVGLSRGEEKVFATSVPRDYTNELLRGKSGYVKIKIVEVFRLDYLNDEQLAKDAGFSDVKTFMENIREYLLEAMRRAQDKEDWRALWSSVSDNMNCSISDAAKNIGEKFAWEKFQTYLNENNVDIQKYFKQHNLNEELVRQKLRDEESLKIRRRIILNYVAEQEKIFATKEELEQAVLASVSRKETTIKKSRKDVDFLSRLSEAIVDAKVVNFLVRSNSIEHSEQQKFALENITM